MRVAACLTAAAVAVAGTLAGIQLATSGGVAANVNTSAVNLSRDGWDNHEPALSPATVGASGKFGSIFATKVNGQVYAQPLVLDSATGSSVIVATQNDWVYSINGLNGTVNWSRQLGSPYAEAAEGCTRPTISPYVGVTSTPVYDPGTGTIYVSALISGPPGDDAHMSTHAEADLFALDAATGQFRWQQPVSISGPAANAAGVVFDASKELQRAGLLLLNGWVYLGYAGLCSDAPGYEGFIAGVNTTSHATTLWTDVAGADGQLGGIWQGGNGLVSDGKSIYASTGNGTPPASGAAGHSAPANVGQSVVRLDVNPSTHALSTGDFFSPGDADTAAAADHDLGSAGPIALPFGTSKYPRILATADKDATVFLLNADDLGGRSPAETGSTALFTGTDGLVYNPPGTISHGLWGHMAAFTGKLPDGSTAKYIYYPGVGWGGFDNLSLLTFHDNDPSPPTLTNIGTSADVFGYGSGSPVITSNGGDASSAVVWMVNATTTGTAPNQVTTGRLEAVRALPALVNNKSVLSTIWSAPIGTPGKFSVVATDNGHVYTASQNDGNAASTACSTTFEDPHYTAANSRCAGVVYGFGAKSAQLATSATSVNLGHVPLGQSGTASVTLTNTGDVPVTVTKITGPGVPFGVTGLAAGQQIPAGTAVRVPVSFTPQARLTMTGKFTVTATDGFTSRTLTIGVGGVGATATAAAVPSPGGGWTLNGSAAMAGTALRLTPVTANTAGSAVFYQPVASNGLKAAFTAQLAGGSGGDGLTFSLISPSDTPAALGRGGSLLGFGGLHGVSVVLGTHKEPGFPAANFIGISNGTAGSGSAAHLTFRAYATAVPSLRGAHVITVTVSGGKVSVAVNGKTYLTAAAAIPATVLPAFTAANGSATDVHQVSAATITPAGGTIPAPGGGWSFNGKAVMSGADASLTPVAANQAGSVVYPRAVATSKFTASFDAQLTSGTGGDGLTLALLNAATAKATSLGAAGQGLGWAGLSGVAVALGTQQLPGTPAGNWVAISAGSSAGVPTFIATKALGALRTGSHRVTVSLVSGTLTVAIDGVTELTQAVSAPSKALVAYTASTGSVTDLHLVRNAAISAASFA
jgi:hypothetical protein